MVPSDTAILDDPSLLTAAGRTRRVGYNVTNWITKETEASLGRPARDYERGDENRNGNGTGDETDSPADAKKEERFPEIRAFFTPTQPLLGPQSGLLQNSNFARPFQPDFSKRAFGQAPHIYSVSEIVCVKEGEPFEIRFEIFGTTPIGKCVCLRSHFAFCIEGVIEILFRYEMVLASRGRASDRTCRQSEVCARSFRPTKRSAAFYKQRRLQGRYSYNT